MQESAQSEEMLASARQLVVTTRRGTLATRLARDDRPAVPAGFPYVSLVLLAPDAQGLPFLLLSDLSEHAKNLQADPAMSLLLEQTAGAKDPLAEPRLTLLGDARVVDDPAEAADLKTRYVAALPSAKVWAGFADFRPYRLTWRAAHLVAGFGRIAWLPPQSLRGFVLDKSPA